MSPRDERLRVAVPKGAVFEDALQALGGAGMPVEVEATVALA